MTKVLRYLLDTFEFRKAAGGVVSNSHDERLMIFRNGRWDLPKGHVEKGETIVWAAMREVEEETGAKNLAADSCIAKTYHIYCMDGRWILKQTAWYDMITFSTVLTPQTEEGIEKAVWVTREQMCKNLATSYSSLSYLGEVLKKRDTI
ncbi:MAG: NUDIX domain-containing protein [Bacteroidales bacterium]|nr:NUDIX domain-containing protein [Bacteroidales bacterium]